MKLDAVKLKKKAHVLEGLLEQYARENNDAGLLLSNLKDLFARVEAGKIRRPLEWNEIPGGKFFDESNLAQYGDLSQAFAEFQIEATGTGDSPILKKIKQMRKTWED